MIPRRSKFAGLKIFQRFHFYVVLKPETDKLIVQGKAVIPRRGKYASLKIFQRFHFYFVLKPVTD